MSAPTHEELQERLAVAEQTLAAIRAGEVDALIVGGPDGPQVYTLEGADTFYRVLIEEMPVGAAAVSRSGAILYANGALARMLGTVPEELTGATLGGLVGEADAQALLALLDGGDGAVTDLRLRGRDGDVEVALSTRPVGPTAADVLCLVAVDLTQRRAVERELEQARQQAVSANAAKDAFLAQMSHELRTPLNAILGFCQLLELEELAEEQRESVDMIGSSSRLLLELIDDVLDFSQIAAGRVQVSLAPVDVADVVGAAVDVMGPLAHERGVELLLGVPRPGLHVQADRRRLSQVLLNLLSNAIKYGAGPAGVRVQVVASPDDTVEIAVVDSGPGIAEELLPQLFEPFQRLGAELRDMPGTGLGLAVAKQLAEAMGGALHVQSTPGKGSRFAVRLPAAEGPQQQRRAAQRNGSGPVSNAAGLVLYVEDSETNALLVRRILERRPGVELQVASTGHEGLALLAQRRPDLVLLDLRLPDIDGDEVLRRIRADPALADVPVVITTADAEPGLAARLLADGALDHATKPLDVRWLLELVDRRLSA